MTNTEARAPEIAQALIENGYSVVPLPHAEKGPNIKDWINRDFRAREFGQNNGVGLKTRHGVVALDVDVYDPAVVEDIVAEFERRFGPTLRRTGRAPKTALLVRSTVPRKIEVKLRPSGHAPVGQNRMPKAEKVEVLTDQQQLVAFGIHPDTSTPYHWHGREPWAPGNGPEDVLPAVGTADLQAFLGWIEAEYGNAVPSVGLVAGGVAALTGYVEPGVVPDGDRNVNLLSYVGHLRGKGTPESLVLGLAQNFNKAKCQPPLDDSEVESVVGRYAAQGHPDPTEWPEPRPIATNLYPAPRLDFDMLPRVFVDFVRDTAERMAVPPDSIAVPLMLASSAALGSGWVVCPKAVDKGWKETPVLWGGLIARPGSKKSGCLQLAAEPLNRIEASQKAVFSQAYAQWQIAKKAAKDDPIAQMGLVEPKLERVVVHDATYQALAEVASTSPNGLMALWDEIAGMIAAWRIKGQEAARGFFLTAWGGDQPYTIDRKESGTTHIPRLSIVISGGVQPSVIGDVVRDARRNNDGLIQRFQLMVYPDDDHAPPEADRKADELAKIQALGAIERLRVLTPRAAGVGVEPGTGRGVLNFAQGAQQGYTALRKKIDDSARAQDCDPLLASHYLKMPGAIAKIAMLIHLLDGGTGDITLEATARAAHWARYMRAHAKRLYSLSQVADMDGANRILDGIKAGALNDGFSARDVTRKGWAGLARAEYVEIALAALVDAGCLRLLPLVTGGVGRSPSPQYAINPKVRD